MGLPGVLFASCPKDVSLVLSVMTNTAQFESLEEREQEVEREEGDVAVARSHPQVSSELRRRL